MYVNSNNYKSVNIPKYKNIKEYRYLNLAPLPKDTVSFGAMKKSQFNSFDLIIVNKFKAQIEKFDTNKDFQDWCNQKLKNQYLNRNYKGRQEEVTEERTAILQEWIDNCLKNSKDYSSATTLFIIDGITKNLKENNDTLPPVLDKEILDSTLKEININSSNNKNYQVDFCKLYSTNLRNKYIAESLNDSNTGWIVIPSYQNDSENFEKNVNKLKTLSPDSWCTNSILAKNCLQRGDFHIYIDKGNPKIGIRFNNDEVEEIQGEKNDYKVPVKYLDIIGEYIKDEKLDKHVIRDFNAASEARLGIETFKNKLGKPVSEATTEELFNIAGIEYERDDTDGLLVIKTYKQPDKNFEWSDLDVNENDFFKEIKEIKEDVSFIGSNVTNLGKLQAIGKQADFRYSKITDLGQLRTIGGYAMFQDSKITTLGNLETIHGDAYFQESGITNLGNLKDVCGSVCIHNSNITPQMLEQLHYSSIIEPSFII